MSLNFKDRVPKYPNRYLLSVEGGTSYYVTLQRADEPTTVGTPLNAATLNQLATIAEMENLPNAHLWKKFSGNPTVPNEEPVENEAISRSDTGYTSGYGKIEYSDQISVMDGEITLVNPETIDSVSTSIEKTIRGKYIHSLYYDEYYFINSNATLSQGGSSSFGFLLLDVSSATKLTVGEKLGFVISDSKDTYPESGEHTDGYWYEYYKQFGDCVGNATGGGVTMSQVNNAIDSAIGDAIGGSY